ncbi:MAG: T9SS type A sorting domain-containing protein [Bacteroidia bacterium]|nr:T9SS type A sorting domain-containing protein [Bacteroidia bacterium]
MKTNFLNLTNLALFSALPFGRKILFTLSLLTCLLLIPRSQAQPIQWITLDSLSVGLQFSTTHSTLQPNEVFSLHLHLESAAGLAASGGWVSLALNSGIYPLPKPTFALPDSTWLGEEAEMQAEYLTASDRWVVTRKDGDTRSGTGMVLTLNFKVGSQPVVLAQALSLVDGGLIHIENIDMKRANPAPDSFEAGIFPNPFENRIHVQQAGPDPVQVFDLSGNLMISQKLDLDGWLDLSALPTGIYLLGFIQDGTGKREFRRIVKR